MRRQRLFIHLLLLAAWALFSFWQYRGYVQQRDLIRETLYQPSQAIMAALLGGIRSHRRVSPYLDEQAQALLDGVVDAGDVLAAAIVDEQRQVLLAAGETSLLHASRPTDGAVWQEDGFQLARSFVLRMSPGAPGGREGGFGMGRGGGWGRGLGGRQRNWELDTESKFTEGERYCALLVLNRERADLLWRRAWWSCVSAVAAAALVAVCLAIAWNATVHLAETRGKARVNEAEMRHLRDLSQAAAGLAHETRNPLGLIRGWTQRLADTDLPAQQRHQVASTMIEECDRVTARINQFLTFARPREPALGPVDLSQLAKELDVILQPDLEAKGVALETDLEPAAAHVLADEDLLRQALFNLLQNAVQFSPRDERIHLSSRLTRDGMVNLAVADHGPGVAAELRSSLFTPYFTTRANGTGLGLAIVRHIARLHGWEVRHEPGSQGGSVFQIRKIHVAAEEHSGRGR